MALRFFREFVQMESSSGVVLCIAALLAMGVANSPLHSVYETFFHLAAWPLLSINDGLMTLFFLLVGLEIKRELLYGELNTLSKAGLPALAALGGMLFPAIFYLIFNHHHRDLHRGWAIPTATDIAFSLGVLSLLGKRIPMSLKIFLTALAIFDDLGAILIIATFYTAHLAASMLGYAAVLTVVLLVLNRCGVRSLLVYLLVGVMLWWCILQSGVHPTIAGIILAFSIPKECHNQLEHKLHPWVAFGILPLFGFANAGVSLQGLTYPALMSSLPLGIISGLFLGKQIGIWGTSMAAIRLRLVPMPAAACGVGLYGIALIAGIGFTMSLFIAMLAFGNANQETMTLVRLGVISGSLVSAVMGYAVLRWYYR